MLVQVGELVFPADFYVLEMKGDRSINKTPILQRRLFLMTARAKIDVFRVMLLMEVDGEIISTSLRTCNIHSTKLMEEPTLTVVVAQPIAQNEDTTLPDAPSVDFAQRVVAPGDT